MKTSEIYVNLTLQEQLSEQIVNALEDLNVVDNVSRQRIESFLNALNEDWNSFKTRHEALLLVNSKIDKKELDKVQQTNYYVQNTFRKTRNAFLEASAEMNTLLEKFPSKQIPNPSVPVAGNAPFVMPTIHRLPLIDIPKFNGKRTEWLSFKDSFSSMVIEDQSLSTIQKFHYLRSCLVGAAAPFLRNTLLTEANFERSWAALEDHYENKRLLIDSTLRSLHSIKKMTDESANELESLFNIASQNLRTLEALGIPLQQCDCFPVFILVDRLDSKTARAWELELGNSKQYPSWDRLKQFLAIRIQSLQAIEQSSGRQRNQSRPQRAGSHQTSVFKPFTTQTKSTNTDIEVVNSQQKPQSQATSLSTPTCILCGFPHYIAKCSLYTSKPVSQKFNIIKEKNLCFNCLGNHRKASCTSTRRCLRCGKKHHTSLHKDVKSSSNITVINSNLNNEITQSTSSTDQTKPDAKQVNHITSESFPSIGSVVLATAMITVETNMQKSIQVRALIDQGSEISLISERLIQQLKLPRENTNLSIIGIGIHSAGKAKGVVHLTIAPHFKSTNRIKIRAFVLPRLTASIASVKNPQGMWPHLNGLQLADPGFMKNATIDMVLGADVYGEIIEEGLRKGPLNGPIAQRTKLGWIISGPCDLTASPSLVRVCHCSVDPDIYELLERFWKLEEVPSEPKDKLKLTPLEQECEEFFKSTYTRSADGRYIVRLPFKSNQLPGESKSRALKMLTHLFHRFSLNKNYFNAYQQFLDEYEKLSHMQEVSQSQWELEPSFYLPHHGVFRESSLSTKLRVVFNGSSKSSNSLSLNDVLHTGAKLQTDLFNVLILFRQYQYVYAADIEKMYRQIQIHQEDRQFQRILWKNSAGKLKIFELSTVTYGLACAPYLALRTVNQLIADEGHKYPKAVSILTDNRYVDDVFGGAETIEEAQIQIDQLNKLCMAGGFPLKKWISNEPKSLAPIDPQNQLTSLGISIEESPFIHTLGLSWQPKNDTFHFSSDLNSTRTITKRQILSFIAKLFDPLGFVAPVLIKAKIFMQDLWAVKLDWDDPLPTTLIDQWNEFMSSFNDLKFICIPRWIKFESDCYLEIHGFSDASSKAIAATIYLRVLKHDKISMSLICSKTKVAPVKRLTIPRLELAAATLLAHLCSRIVTVLKLGSIPIHLWTDSTIVLTWINQHPSKWKDYVHNRVVLIQSSIPQAQWHFIKGLDNPADCATRGMTPQQLGDHILWWHGPSWLKTEHYAEHSADPVLDKSLLEEKPSRVVNIVTKKTDEVSWELFTRYSSLTRLLRITALCKRIFNKHRSNINAWTPIMPEELEEAKLALTSHVQRHAFNTEIKILSQENQLPRSHSLSKLTPFLDDRGLMRVGGRLEYSLLVYDSKHPLILPQDSKFSQLIIEDAHNRTLHGSTQETLTFIRSSFWILGGRAPIRSFILKCVKCTILRRRAAQQRMGQLPPHRVTPSLRAFIHTGLDYAGPYLLKTWRGKNARQYKAYIVLFICLSTSAIHLEIATDYTAEGFLAAYRRFTSRRGICQTLSSDCGTNLKGADAELKRLFSSASDELGKFSVLIANDGTKWSFNPPAAPHFGGKWEAGVKSVKYHLRRVMGETLLTYEEFSTLLTQVEATLNSRPLCPLTDDPDDLAALTPGHFLIGHPLNLIPEPSLRDIKSTRLSRWQMIRQMLECFWSKWTKDCLQRYLAIYKWNQSHDNIQPNQLVLVMDERYPPSKWPLGRILEVYPSKDGLVRIAKVKTQESVLTRPIVKLCPLPINQDTL